MRGAGSQQPAMKILIGLTVTCVVVFVVSSVFAAEGVDELPRFPSSGNGKPRSLTDPTTWLVGLIIIGVPVLSAIMARWGWQVRTYFFILGVPWVALLGMVPAALLIGLSKWRGWALPTGPVLLVSMAVSFIVYAVYLVRQKDLEK